MRMTFNDLKPDSILTTDLGKVCCAIFLHGGVSNAKTGRDHDSGANAQ